MKKYLIFLLLAFIGCTFHPNELSEWLKPNGKLKVLCTTGMIEDIVGQVGGDHVDTIILVKGELDPHSYQLVKGDDEKLAYADIVFYNGLGLEHGPSLREFLESNSNAVGLGNWIQEKNPSLVLKYQGILDPHIWMDVSLWAETVPKIVEVLSAKDPQNAEEYRERGARLYDEMMETHGKLRDSMKLIPQTRRFLITSHDAFNYFARAYLSEDHELLSNQWQKRFAAPEGLAPESQLSASDIRQILNHMKKYNVRVIFPESNVSLASIQKLMNAGNEEGLNLEIAPGPLYGDSMGAPGSPGDTYLKMLIHNVDVIAKYLKMNGDSHEK